MPDREPLGLYVHIPFCERKCTYCHFAIDPRRPEEERQQRYLRALLQEISDAVEQPPSRRADSIYLGGGTPTLLSLDRMARLLEALREGFLLSSDAEVTVEANPRDLDASGYLALRGLGVNRLSLGVQAFDDAVLHEMGRLHTAEDARAAYAAVRAAGFDNVSIDLILGWPGESAARWRRALAQVAELRPDHVSLYVLEAFGKTLLAHQLRRGGVALPDDDVVADLYAQTVDTLEAVGIHRYEISNFARPGKESRHNGKYWADAPFLGFGMSAHSYWNGRRSWNASSFGAYCSRIEQSGPLGAREGERVLSEEERRSEALFTGLRRSEGIDLARFIERYGIDPQASYEEPLREPLAAGLIESREGRLRLTERGVLLSNEVFRAFV